MNDKVHQFFKIASCMYMLKTAFFSVMVVFSQPTNDLKIKAQDSIALRTTVSVNMGAFVVLSRTFNRFHLPINVERTIRSDRSLVVGIHPAFVLNNGHYREAFGTSCRIRWFLKPFISRRPWIEVGIWGIYQRNRLGNHKTQSYRNKLCDSMIGLNTCIGWKFPLRKRPWIIQLFVGVAMPVICFTDNGNKLFGYPFSWSGLGVGYVF